MRFNKTYLLIPIILLAVFINIHNSGLPELDGKAFETAQEMYQGANHQIIRASAQELASKYKTFFQDNQGHPYLLGGDTWHYYRLMSEVVDNGKIGQVTESGINHNQDKLGTLIPPFIFFPSVVGNLNRILQFPNLPVAYYTPTFLAVLILLMVFLITKKIFDIDIALVTTLLVAIHPRFYILARAGIFDTAPLNILFTLIIVYCFIKIRDNIIWSIPFAASLYLFYISWSGFFYIIPILFTIFIVQLFLYKNKKQWYYLIPLGILLIVVIIKYQMVFGMLQYGFSYLSSSSILRTTDELQTIGISSLSTYFSFSILLFSIVGVFIGFYRRNKSIVIPLIWGGATFIVALNAARMVNYSIIPLCMLASYGLWEALTYLDTHIDTKYYLRGIGIFGVGVFLIIPNFTYPDSVFCTTCPMMSDSLWNAGQKISEVNDSRLIITWWDYGYPLQVAAQTPTISDGGMLDNKRESIIAKALMAKDEDESVTLFKRVMSPVINLSSPPRIFVVLPEDILTKVQVLQYLTQDEFIIPIGGYPQVFFNITGEDRTVIIPKQIVGSMLMNLLTTQGNFTHYKLFYDTGKTYLPYAGRVVVYELSINDSLTNASAPKS